LPGAIQPRWSEQIKARAGLPAVADRSGGPGARPAGPIVPKL